MEKEKLREIAHPDYLPSDQVGAHSAVHYPPPPPPLPPPPLQDILHAWQKTTDIYEAKFVIDRVHFQ